MSTISTHILRILFLFAFLYNGLMVIAQSEKTVSSAEGYVVDDISGDPLPFVNIYFENTTIGTTSDVDGKYKIKARHHNDTLVFSMIGYQEIKVYVKPGNKYSMIIRLKEDSQTLEEVVIKPGENPAHPIFRSIIKNKDRNNPEKHNKYNCQTYTAVNASFSNITEENIKTLVPKTMRNSLPIIKNSEGKEVLPFYLTEKISVNYIDNNNNISQMKRLNTNSKALLGFDKLDAKGYTNSLSAELNFYNNYLDLFSQKFISPLNNNGLATYKYYLEDSLTLDGQMIYQIKFVPKREKDLAFNGYFEVIKDVWAVTYIEASLPKSANINFLNTFDISYSYDFVGDSNLFFKGNTIKASFHYLKRKDEANALMIEVNKETLYDEIVIGDSAKPLEYSIIEKRDTTAVFVDSVFTSFRSGSRMDSFEETSSTIDSTNSLAWVKKLEKVTNMFITGYFNLGKFELGPYLGIFKYNTIEGTRVGMGVRTSEKFNPNYSVGAYLGYGFKDKEWKYSFFGEYKLKTEKRTIFGAKIEKDLYLFGVFSHINLIKENMVTTGEDSFIASIFKRYQSERRAMLYRYQVYMNKEWSQGVNTNFSYEYDELRQGVYVPFIHKGEPVDYVYNNSLSLNLRLSWDENLTDMFLRRYYLNTNYPVINILGTAGVYTVGGDNGNYFKLHLTLKHKVAIGVSKLYYVFEAGKIFGDVPFPLLNIVRGNDTYANSRYRFNLLNNATAAMDTYAGIMLEHHFNGVVMNKIPVLRELNIRALISAKYIVGTLSNRHQYVLEYPWDMQMPGGQYLELGAGIENIFRIIRVEAIWRPVPEEYPDMPKYGVRVRLDLSM